MNQKTIIKGSLKDIRLLINQSPQLLNSLLKNKIKEISKSEINWISPLKENKYIEYQDEEFINKIGVKLKYKLYDFWPNKGPHWDGLGKTDDNVIFLIEAKANIKEIVTPESQAKSSKSIDLISRSLYETKTYLGIENSVDWSGKFYQYTNRIAHLYFLRVQNKIPTYLINIYFINDESVNGPKSRVEWESALEVMKTYLGVRNNKLSKYIIDLFIDINDII